MNQTKNLEQTCAAKAQLQEHLDRHCDSIECNQTQRKKPQNTTKLHVHNSLLFSFSFSFSFLCFVTMRAAHKTKKEEEEEEEHRQKKKPEKWPRIHEWTKKMESLPDRDALR